ncbi:hypothetical protein Tco_0477342 [Tanacetum coccineum]
MDNDLFTYEVEVANIPCDSKIDNDSEQKADDDMESSDDEDDIAEVFRIDTNIFDYETPLCSAFKEFNYLLEVDPDLLTKDIIGFKTYEDYKRLDPRNVEQGHTMTRGNVSNGQHVIGRMMDTVMEKIYPELTLLETNFIIRITSEYVAVKEDEYDDLTVTRKEACRAYQEIFQIMDEGWMVTIAE